MLAHWPMHSSSEAPFRSLRRLANFQIDSRRDFALDFFSARSRIVDLFERVIEEI